MQVDNSTPGPETTSDKNRQSLIPVTIKQLKNALAGTNGENGFTLDGRDLHQVTVVGLIMHADEQQTNLQYQIDDGTDTIMVKKWTDADAPDDEAERRALCKEGAYVRVIGQLRSFNHAKNIVAYSIEPITDFNEYTFHFLEVVHTHLRHTKGAVPAAAAAGAAAGAYGAPVALGMVRGAAPVPGAPAARAPGASLQDLVLKFFQSKGAASDAGCTVLEAAQALASNGVQEAQVRSIVLELVEDGHLYSTIDDEHFKST
jgi:replication factor A2